MSLPEDNLAIERATFVSHLECGLTGERFPADRVATLSSAGKPLLVRYELEALSRGISRSGLEKRANDFWRYREFLPVRHAQNIVSLGETMTPLLSAPRLRHLLGGGEILIKDEGRLPTGSFKARGLALAVSMAKELGIKRMAMATAGNAGAALAAYCSRAGIASYVFCPDDAPPPNVGETVLEGARLYKVNGLINDCAKIVAEGKEAMGWFDTSTLKEPYRIEGKKTMGLELAEQLGWTLPDAIFYPTGGGTGLIGMWKVFDELGRIGWLDARRPRMIAVQSTGCAPIVRAFERGQEFAEPWQNAETVASGLRVPAALGDFLILRAIRASNGFAVAIPDEVILEARAEVGREEGLLLSPEGAATYAAYRQALKDGRIGKGDRVVLFNCGNGLKYPMPDSERHIDRHKPIDYAAL
ncbi:MAG TPA: threonine synthase [Alphaproteobacteria bacterium]|nr:threonine synthase [Alphaproteobacteria bacterium]